MYDGFTLFESFVKNSKAIFVKAYLEDRGIRVILNLSHVPFGGFRMSFALHKLFVHNEDLAKAEKLYEEFKKQESDGYDHDYTDEEFEELAVNAKFEDYDPDPFDNSAKMVDSERLSENYQGYEAEISDSNVDEPYYQTGVRLSLSKDLIHARIDQKLDENKVYKCPNCADKFLEQQKMEGGMKFLFTLNYLFILIIVIAYIATAGRGESNFAQSFVKILPLNIGIAIYHIISVSTSKYRCEICGHVEKH